jgi:glucose-6-phosphate dehydrogenase assembly protein OpcA
MSDEIASASWAGTDVDVGTLERHMAELWRQVTSETEGAAGVRTSILNLVVYARDGDDAKRISSELRSCTDRHPSRTIILVGDRHEPQSSVDASVTTYCVPSKDHPPLCYEEMVFTGHGRVADHLSSIVIPFVIPGLPTYLWWPGQPPFGHRIFHRLLSVVDQLIVDSAQFNTPADGIANLALLSRAKQGINDFNWARLRPWREIIAQFFDGPHWAPYAQGIRSIRMEYGSGASDYRRAAVGTLLTLGWLAEELGWEPESTLDAPLSRDFSMSVLQGDRVIDIDLNFRDPGSDAAGHLMALEFVADPKGLPPARFKVIRSDDLRRADVSATVHEGTDIRRAVPLELESDADLLTHELEMAGHDRLYEQIVETASRLAGRELFIPA